MYLYLILYFLLVISFLELAKFRIKDAPHFYQVAYWGIIVVIIILSTFRWENGTDWKTYYDYFNLVGLFPEYAHMELGYTWLCHINYQLTGSYTFHLGVMALLCIVPVAKRIKQYSPFPFCSLFIWFCVSLAHLFPVRQTIAISLFVFAWKYMIERRWWIYLIVVVIAASFHYTVLVTIPVYFLWNKHFSTKFIMVVVGGAFVLAFTSSQLLSDMFYIIGGDFFEKRLSAYMENSEEVFGSAYSSLQILVRGAINRGIYLFIPLFLLNRTRKTNVFLNGMFNMYLYSFILFLCAVPLSVALGRLTVFTDMAQLFLILYLLTLKFNKGTEYIMISVLILYFLMRFNGVVNNYYDLYIPYHFCFSV